MAGGGYSTNNNNNGSSNSNSNIPEFFINESNIIQYC